jgi:transcriptional regulator with XRE-family HTH domain
MDIDGPILREARLAGGYTVRDMARLTGFSHGQVSNVEGGHRRPTPRFVDAYRRVLGDSVDRRGVLASVAATAAVGLVADLSTMAEVLRLGFDRDYGTPDWAEVVANFEAEFAHLPSTFGPSLFTQLAVLRQTIAEQGPTSDRLHAFAGLSRLWALWLGNAGRFPEARGWYATAAKAAERSGDQVLRAYIYATEANRGPYERHTIRTTLDLAGRALDIFGGASAGTVEAHGAIVHVSALTGNLAGGRSAVEAMHRAAEALPGDAGNLARTRADLFEVFLEFRIGDDPDRAERTFAAAEPSIAAVDTWHHDARVYRELHAARRGDHEGAAERTLALVGGYRTSDGDVPMRVLGVAVADLLDALPAAWAHIDTVIELTRYADPNPGPWKTLR